MKRVAVALGITLMAANPAHAGFWDWLSAIMMPPNGLSGGTGDHTVAGYFNPETFGSNCNETGCSPTPCGDVHFYPFIGPVSVAEAVRLYQVGKATLPCLPAPVIEPPILGLN